MQLKTIRQIKSVSFRLEISSAIIGHRLTLLIILNEKQRVIYHNTCNESVTRKEIFLYLTFDLNSYK